LPFDFLLLPSLFSRREVSSEMLLKFLFVALAYLLGSIPFGYLLVKYLFTRGEDVRRVGSGGTGATNVARRAGAAAGLLTYVFDVAKGVAAVTLMRTVAADDYSWIGAAAIAAIVGHVFPVFLGFRGGKGVATGVGVYIVLAPYSVLTTLVLWVIIVYFTRYVSLASIVATSAVPLWTLLYYGFLQPNPHLKALVIIALGVCMLIVGKHHENINRLIHGTENKLGARVGSGSGVAAGGAPVSGEKS
jgi:acyl phosphate:glycerol-3-phosphate acyltransferase